MRFLLDKNISFRLCSSLDAHGHDAVHVDDLSLGDADDREILQRARQEERTLISSDTDFGALLAAERATTPSVILTREVSTLPSDELADLLHANLDAIAQPLEAGAVVAIGQGGVRVRLLPLR